MYAIRSYYVQMIFQWTIKFMDFFNQGQTISVGRAFWFQGQVSRSEHYLFWYYAILVVVVLLRITSYNVCYTKLLR